MRYILTLWASLLSVSVLADSGRSWSSKDNNDHDSPPTNPFRNWRHEENDLTARTPSGTFTGFIDPSVPDVNQWLGIPYGAPPTGDQRFLPPKPAAHSGEIATTEYKPICNQNSKGPESGGVFWDLVPEFQNADPQAEDCLFLNIWGPRGLGGGKGRWSNRGRGKVPVVIWSELSKDQLSVLLR
jgi:hypothetical protein